ncbi:hypothetical protein [Streptomyces roseochromogenus]|uniref:Uncharacterized protein n=1 Tax=Streptomyces roseochromogenus subsp. oscitans DS 12.976 TaxID=1352936 RepID=V6KWD6_STRRC|nr:hypothetical protein [Streptomyces roseochromogenus]EST36485.1 hypothetical protein M878_02015 [Streptomyces roseochromogenus subsp. oscitans DS 12.976]
MRTDGEEPRTRFFTVDDESGRTEELASLLETFANGLDIARRVTALTDAISRAGLTAVRAESIGAHVWPERDLRLSRWWAPGTWPRNFLRAYERRILDYYVVTAERPRQRDSRTARQRPTAGLGRVA